ncbi:MAG: MaoC family dehydratase N-terminal domain-containing protein [Dehalococcoidia bacterium]|nr:MaoC family dehydratase N-terminal domain-containing protein [Dehalococcoidia bacterium]
MAEGSVITEELRKMIGVPSDPIIFKVEEGAIQRYAQAIGDLNPLFNDVENAGKNKNGRLICPPGFTGWPIKGGISFIKLVESLIKAGAPPRLLDGGVEFEFFEPIGAGDVLTATTKIANMVERETKMGKTMFTKVETTFLNQNGDVVLKSWSTMIQF